MKYLIVLLASFFSFSAFAQDSLQTEKSDWKYGMGTTVGVQLNSMGALNTLLEQNRYPALSNANMVISLHSRIEHSFASKYSTKTI